jgi:hypothetical protein
VSTEEASHSAENDEADENNKKLDAMLAKYSR